MTVIRTYLCPGVPGHGQHELRYLHHPSVEADPLPRFCSACGFDTRGDEEAPLPLAVTSPPIQKSIKGVVDTMHRQMEGGAQFRADMMAEKFGMDSSETRSMLETDMRDNVREGDTTFISVSNEVTQVMQSAPGLTGFNGAAGSEFSAATGVGPAAGRHGNAARMQLRQQHAAFTAGAGHAGATSAEVPVVTR